MPDLNLLTDIPGIRVGHAQEPALGTGVTAILFDRPAIASGSFTGGAPALRESALLEPENMVERIHAVTLSGGSTYGLDATTGVQALLRERFDDIPLPPGTIRVPIVVQASLYDLPTGGLTSWGRYSPYAELGYAAAAQAESGAFTLGTCGAGTGATTATLRGGLGSASTITPGGHRVAALVAVNAVGSATIGDGPHFWSAPFEQESEFGGLGMPRHLNADDLRLRSKFGSLTGTTIGLVATDATLSKTQAHRLAILAQDGVARGIFPAHLPLDGDAMFAVSTTASPPPSNGEWTEILHAAMQVTARAIARGVYEATPLATRAERPTWREMFG